MTPRRRRGRPALVEGQRAEAVWTTVPPEVHAYLCGVARKRNVPLSAIIRIAVLRLIRDERATHPAISQG